MFDDLHLRVLEAVAPVCRSRGVLLAGGLAMRVHGFSDRPRPGLELAVTGAAEGLAEELAARVGATGLIVGPVAGGRVPVRDMSVTDEVPGLECAITLRTEHLRERPLDVPDRPGLPQVVGRDDAVGLAVRALYERGLPGDLADVAGTAGGYSFRELERLAGRHSDGLPLDELIDRLEGADLLSDKAFPGLGADGARRVRGFARAWAEDVKLRRADDGDIPVDVSDVPAID
ncbi:hypothetical protein [Nonomuraea longicatena]|uniref:Nucleotidyl transferase n=1 Tax=Nonomuraea longicatena TaxID=83682 RepID=A0ABN1RA38_9ACTN